MQTASPFEPSTSALEAFFLGVLEASVNRILAFDPDSVSKLSELTGTVIRIKTTEPEWAFYVLFSESGIQVAPFYDGIVDARINTTSAHLLSLFFSKKNNLNLFDPDLKVSGDPALIETFFLTIKQYDMLAMSQHVLLEWFPDLNHWPHFVEKLSAARPDWWDTLLELPGQFQRNHQELQQSLRVQQDILQELREIRLSMEGRQQQVSSRTVSVMIVVLLCGFGFWLGWFFSGGGV